jgi:hypothetical protein
MQKAPAVESVHATIAPADTLLAERRALYSLAVELLCADAGDVPLPDDLLDSPPVRFRIGEGLAGRATISARELVACRDALGETRFAHGLPVIADDGAHQPLATLLEIIRTRPGLRLLTEGPRFEAALRVVRDGVALAREVSPHLTEDLLAHVNLVALLDPETSHGLASASSRWFPGIVLLDAPATPIEVAEGLIHEGAHQKFFDFAITRQFLGHDADTAEQFETSWSHARWPMEQTVAAWHAYTCMHRFAVDSGVTAGERRVAASSLLPEAEKRAAEIGGWLVEHRSHLQVHANVLLYGLLMREPEASYGTVCAEPIVTGRLKVDPLVRLGRYEQRGRRLVAKAVTPPELFWIESNEAQVLRWIVDRVDGAHVDEIVAHEAASLDLEPEVARPRVMSGLRALLQSGLIQSV